MKDMLAGDTTLTVHVSRIHPRAELPDYKTTGAAAFDLAAVEDISVQPGGVALIPTGLVVQVPLRMFLGIFARSSTPLKRGLMIANGVGVVDPDYCGPADEVKIAVFNFSPETVTVRAGERIAQGIFLDAPKIRWEESAPAGASRGGFGSSGL